MSDQALLELVSAPAPTTIAGVLQLMEGVQGTVTGNDGLKWFNFLYMTVTRQILEHPPASGWRNPAWFTRLDVVFGNFYFAALAQFLQSDNGLASSWAALLEARHQTGIDRIQFALAGMNAHINHDLALALIQTNQEFGLHPSDHSPEHDDYEHVNDTLEAAMPTALQTLAVGLVGEIVQDTGKIGRLLAIWSVRAARDLAWNCSCNLSALPEPARAFSIDAQDGITGALGRALLLPL